MMADDVGATLDAVNKWYQRDSIPPELWPNLITSGGAHGVEVTVGQLLKIRKSRRFHEGTHRPERGASQPQKVNVPASCDEQSTTESAA